MRQGDGLVQVAWTAAFTLGLCAVLGCGAAAVLGAGHGWAAAAAGAMVALLLMTLVLVRRRYGGFEAEKARSQQLAAQWRQLAEQAERLAGERRAREASALEEAAVHLVRVQLPAVFSGSPVPPLPDSVAAAHAEAAALCGRAAGAAADGAARLREELAGSQESNRQAVVKLARRVQTSAQRIQEEATRMTDRHPGDPDVLASSMLVDHAAAQQARHAQSLAVLCGEWPGQQWPQPVPLPDVVRAAAGRILPYKRVKVQNAPDDADVAAAASIVEPLIHLTAELLANAAQSSPPTTEVVVTVRTVQRGAVIEVDDCGVGMEEHQLEQLRAVASGRRLLGLGDLGEIPQTGIAVIGHYVSRHGLRVDLAQSPYGGVRAVVLVPASMLASLEPAAAPAPRYLPAPPGGGEPGRTDRDALPQRQSRRGRAAPAPPQAAGPALPAQTPQEAGQWMGAFFSGSAGGPGAGSGTPPAPSAARDADAFFPGGTARAAPGRADPPGSSTDSPGNEQA